MSDVHLMTTARLMTTASGCHFQSKPSCGFPAPSINDFFFKPAFSIGGVGFTKPILLMLLSAAIVLVVFWLAFRKPKRVPRGVQNVGELGILFIRDQILRPQMGSKGDRYLPFLVSLFFFIWLMNLWELIPLAQFPATSKFAFPLGLTLVVWVTYMFIGMKHQGPIGYFKNMAVPQGAPWWILPLLSPLELLSNIIVRPFTLSIRLFANMLSGHLLLLVFSIATWYLFTATIGLLFAAVSFLVFLLVFTLEVLITFLQAFIFATLTSFYISDALESAH
jgi:F-type H+-transporting ATPase subunit a